jgi:ribosomal protein RSM22 (predicted rRNA methylase)
MQLPPPLRRAIDEELAACGPAQLRAAAARLSQCYRQPGAPGRSGVSCRVPGCEASESPGGGPLADDAQRAAYLAVRLPATFAAVVAALGWTRQAYVEGSREEIRTMLDLGSGPGTAVWAAAQVFPTLGSATAIERDPRLIEIGRSLSAHADDAVVRQATWLRGDLTAGLPQGAWDLVVCSYALNELGEAQRAELIRQAWARTAKLLVVVEPGTPAGFANILAVRTRLLAAGAVLAAPCPNSLACPMAGGGDWCHFAARVERTAGHRRLKEATLGHEDEKFSYIAFSRHAPAAGGPSVGPYPTLSPAPQARIVRHPRIFSGYTQLTLCREGQIAATTVTRSHKEDWRRLKRLGWGDRW